MRKEIKIGIIVCCLILALFVLGLKGFDYYSEQRKIIKEKDPGLTLLERQIYETRIADLDKALSEAKDDNQRFDLYMQKGFNLYGLGKLSESVEWYTKAAELRSADTRPYVAMYQSQLDMNDNRAAESSIKKALSVRADLPDIWKKYIDLEANRFLESNKRLNELYAEAIAATVQNASHADIITSYAVFLEKSGDLIKAKEYWQKAIELNPENTSLYLSEIKRLEALMK